MTCHLATGLAQRLGVASPPDGDSHPLDTLAATYLQTRGRRLKFTEELYDLCIHLDVSVPEPLRQLAEIEHFSIYITTGFDPLLTRALAEARGLEPEVLAYAPRQLRDLPGSLQQIRQRGKPLVYHLLGEPSTNAAHWAITEEDRLEFYHALQAPNRQPEILFSELRDRHLLLLGGGHPDWLARFFLRTIKGDRLSLERSVEEIIADPAIFSRENTRLREFLTRYSPQTRVYPSRNPSLFVAELHRRYSARHPRGGEPCGPFATRLPGAASRITARRHFSQLRTRRSCCCPEPLWGAM